MKVINYSQTSQQLFKIKIRKKKKKRRHYKLTDKIIRKTNINAKCKVTVCHTV